MEVEMEVELGGVACKDMFYTKSSNSSKPLYVDSEKDQVSISIHLIISLCKQCDTWLLMPYSTGQPLGTQEPGSRGKEPAAKPFLAP